MSTELSPSTTRIVKVLHEMAAATHDDWSDYDGKSDAAGLGILAGWVENGAPEIDEMRIQMDLCPKGLGHWTSNCLGKPCDL